MEMWYLVSLFLVFVVGKICSGRLEKWLTGRGKNQGTAIFLGELLLFGIFFGFMGAYETYQAPHTWWFQLSIYAAMAVLAAYFSAKFRLWLLRRAAKK